MCVKHINFILTDQQPAQRPERTDYGFMTGAATPTVWDASELRA